MEQLYPQCPQGVEHKAQRRHAVWTATTIHPWGATPLPVAQVSLWEVRVMKWPCIVYNRGGGILDKTHPPNFGPTHPTFDPPRPPPPFL